MGTAYGYTPSHVIVKRQNYTLSWHGTLRSLCSLKEGFTPKMSGAISRQGVPPQPTTHHHRYKQQQQQQGVMWWWYSLARSMAQGMLSAGICCHTGIWRYTNQNINATSYPVPQEVSC